MEQFVFMKTSKAMLSILIIQKEKGSVNFDLENDLKSCILKAEARWRF